MNKKERLEIWASDLSGPQVRILLVDLVDYLSDTGTVRFWDDSLSPYWESSGETLVAGQKCFEDEF